VFALERGAVDFLYKPFYPVDVDRMLHKVSDARPRIPSRPRVAAGGRVPAGGRSDRVGRGGSLGLRLAAHSPHAGIEPLPAHLIDVGGSLTPPAASDRARAVHGRARGRA
jgi:hypothetical protein